MHALMRAARFAPLWVLLCSSCTEKPAEPGAPLVEPAVAAERVPTGVAVTAPTLTQPRVAVAVERTPAELDAALRQACSQGLVDKEPLLLDFGANWCGDCKKLHIMKERAPIADELAHFQVVDINITDPDKHAALMRAYQVKAIARWVVLRPTDCSAPVTDWPRGATRVVEPSSSGDATADQLVAWLRAARG